MSQSLWKWELDPKAIYKKCPCCSDSLMRGKETLVQYKDSVYHLHCLLDFLTEHHEKTRVKDPVEFNGFNWGITP